MAGQDDSETGDAITGLAGLAGVVREIPEESRKQIVDAALKVIAPVTALTGGVSELIAAQFTTWHRLHQIRAAEILKAAAERSRVRSKVASPPSPRVICSALAIAAQEPNDNIRELWTNLVANELSGEVHPEFVDVLGRLSHSEALRLLELASRERKWSMEILRTALRVSLKAVSTLFVQVDLPNGPRDFLDAHLERLGLVSFGDAAPKLTLIGNEFLRCVSDPSFDQPTGNP